MIAWNKKPLSAMLGFLGSMKLGVTLLVILVGVLFRAAFLDMERAQWLVYHSPWFVGLLGLLAINVLAAALLRTTKKRKLGFLVTHVGLLALMAGALATYCWGIEGHLAFQEGETASMLTRDSSSQFTARWEALHGASPDAETAFIFPPGPLDWPAHKTLLLGRADGVELRVLKYYAHARAEEAWVSDPAGQAGPALRFALLGPDGASLREEWLAADPFEFYAYIGPAKLELQQASAASMLDDFYKPPETPMDRQGVLSLHYQGQMTRINVSEHLGKKVPVGQSRIAVEIAEYLPDAMPKPGSGVHFASADDEPKNPLLELRVYLPDAQEPLRQIAFAKNPFMSLDAIHARTCPVKFWYHHPAVRPESGVEFLQTPDGKLHFRTIVDGKCGARGNLSVGDEVPLRAGFKVRLAEYIPSARHQATFQPAEAPLGDSRSPEAAALVEVVAGETTQQFWFKRNDASDGLRKLITPRGILSLTFGSEEVPLGFSLKLLKFTRGLNPGGMGDASYSSVVEVNDRQVRLKLEREISMNHPLTYDRYTFYQSSFQELPDGKTASVLSVAYDPGLWLKFAGSSMVCLGILLMFCTRMPVFQERVAVQGDCPNFRGGGQPDPR